jgi:SAM-dependent methyltransferase
MRVPLQNGGEMDFIDFPQEVHPERLYAASAIGGCRRILDVGCGLHKTVPYAVGIDISPVTDIEASADNLPFADGSCNYIIARHILEHLVDPVKAIKEWIRVVHSGDRIVLILPNHSEIDTMSYVISCGTHLHVYTPESLHNLLGLFNEISIVSEDIVIDSWSFGCIVEVQ